MAKQDKQDEQRDQDEQDKKDRRSGKYSVSMHGVSHTFKTPHEAAAMVNFLNGGPKYDPKALEDVFAQNEEDEERQKTIEQEKKDSAAQAEKMRMDALDPHEREIYEKQGKNGKKDGLRAAGEDGYEEAKQMAPGVGVGAVKGQNLRAYEDEKNPPPAGADRTAKREQEDEGKGKGRSATAARRSATKKAHPKATRKPQRKR
ncbi:MAG TPA: hypothetical protein VLL28_02575 [Hyphomicrobiaceae bacterium]|jgi:hypothetical protein|nr:hypothetical protein [Hyphomicrobiaceae bacterium]